MRTDRFEPNSPPYLLYALLGSSFAMNGFLFVDRFLLDDDAAPAPTVVMAAPAPAQPLANAAIPVPTGVVAGEVVQMPDGPAAAAGYQIVHAKVEQSLAYTFNKAIGEQGDALSAVFTRLFVWDLAMNKDLAKGDEVWAAWSMDGQGTYDMPVAWLKSNKLGTTLKAYRYTAPGDTYSSYWFADGTEVPHRLVNGPMANYEQITSLLKDRPTHKGMDFKTPVGTPVVSPKAGTVTRVNWNHAANGNCVEVRFTDGTVAKFLHLDKLDVQAGQHVDAGQKLADSGNTGHSTAPHLHYQLENGSRVVDPLEYHGTTRRKLPDSAMPAFQAEMARLDAMLGASVAAL